MNGKYAFWIRLRFDPPAKALTVEDPIVERRCFLEAAEPGTAGWLFFRDALWRGEVSDQGYARERFAEKLGVAGHPGITVEDVEFRGLHTDETYLDALKAEIATDLDAFRADDVTEVLSKYLGSSIQVIED